MSYLEHELRHLEARLPELEWKLSLLHGKAFNAKKIPRGLFRMQSSCSAEACIEEIKRDMSDLKKQSEANSVHYLASLINRKITVLVRLCQSKDEIPLVRHNSLKKISTRQQWLQTLAIDLEKLSQQQKALTTTLARFDINQDKSAYLKLNTELSEVTRRLNALNETIARFSGNS